MRRLVAGLALGGEVLGGDVKAGQPVTLLRSLTPASIPAMNIING